MNTRDYKLSAPGEFFHVYNRGNAKENIFLDEEDFKFFLLRLKQNLIPSDDVSRHFKPLPPNSFDLVAYCLMPNHFHFLIKQNTDLPISKLMGKLCTSYGMYFNKKYRRVGHIFQDQFRQINIDSNNYLAWLSAYIHNNPVDAGLTKKPEDWGWSSYSCFINSSSGGKFVKPQIILDQYGSGSEYEVFIAEVSNIKRASIPEDFLLDAE